MKYSVAMTAELEARLSHHLARTDGQEDLCFAVWFPSQGATRYTALVSEVLLPEDGERRVHRNASFAPEYLLRALARARGLGAGLAFLHSHPFPGWQDMSLVDVRAESGMAGAVLGATGLPLLGLTLGAVDRTWSARFWHRTRPKTYERAWCETVRVVGERLRVHYCDELLPPSVPSASQVRTVSAWGERTQADVARLRVGIIGLGSVGSIVAEALARTGIDRLSLIDFDRAKELNRDRTLNLSAEAARQGLPKVAVQAKALKASATSERFAAEPILASVCEELGYRHALDCDVLFSCVDRPWGRSVLNFTAYAHLIPTIDGGLLASQTRSGRLRGADWKAHVAGPGRSCLRCVKQFDPGHVQVDRDGLLDDPKYIEGLPDDHPLRARQNVFVFSLGVASLQLCQFTLLTATSGGLGARHGQNYHLATGTIDPMPDECEHDCEYPRLTARGEAAGHPGTGRHPAAEAARAAST